MERIKPKHHKVVVALALVAWLVTLYYFLDDVGSYRDRPRKSAVASRRRVLSNGEPPSPPAPFEVCGRPAGYHAESWTLQQQYAACPTDRQRSILILDGKANYGRTGNQLRSLMYALQYARDNSIHLGILYNSWAMKVLLDFFFAEGHDSVTGDDAAWRSKVERTLCVEIFHGQDEYRGRGWRIIRKTQRDLFTTASKVPIDDLVASQLQILRALFQNHNTGEGCDRQGKEAGDVCSGIDALFGVPADIRSDPPWTKEEHDLLLRSLAYYGDPGGERWNSVARIFGGTRSADQIAAHYEEYEAHRGDPDYRPYEPGASAPAGRADPRTDAYSVVHLRNFEGGGAVRLGKAAKGSGCDPSAALEMKPAYVKGLLRPLGMLGRPVVVITDGQDRRVLDRLREDPELGPTVRTVPMGARWFGGDVALGVMADVFIGNPASTMSGFIAKSRVALGRENTFVHVARNKRGEWTQACGHRCLFRYPDKGSYEEVLWRLKGGETRVPLFPNDPPRMTSMSAEQLRSRAREAAGEAALEVGTAR